MFTLEKELCKNHEIFDTKIYTAQIKTKLERNYLWKK